MTVSGKRTFTTSFLEIAEQMCAQHQSTPVKIQDTYIDDYKKVLPLPLLAAKLSRRRFNLSRA